MSSKGAWHLLLQHVDTTSLYRQWRTLCYAEVAGLTGFSQAALIRRDQLCG